MNNSKLEETYSERQVAALARFEKIQADGKWLWIFKRGAIWVTMSLFLYGFGAILYPSQFNFQISQFYILFGMFGAFIFSSIMEWSKMEEIHQKNELN